MGSYDLRKVQMAVESVKGTAGTAFRIMTGLDGQIKDASELKQEELEFYTGMLTGDYNSTPVFVSDIAELKLEGDLTAENAVYMLANWWQDVSPTVSTATATWVFNPPTTATNTRKTHTIETGDDYEQLRATYAIATEFEIKASANDVTKVSTTFAARSVTAVTTGFSAATAISSANYYPANLWKIYSDPTGSSVGTTQLTSTLREWTLKGKNGAHQKQYMDGVLYPTGDGQARPSISLDLVLEYNTNAALARQQWKAKTMRRIRLQQGAATSTMYGMTVDLAAYINDVDTISSAEGNSTVGVSLMLAPAGTAATDYLRFIVVNGLTAGL